MEIKKLLKKVKDKHNEIKEKINIPKNNLNNSQKSKKNFDAFNSEEAVKRGLGLKNDIFIPQEKITTFPEEDNRQLELIEKTTKKNFPKFSKTGNYIIQPGDTGSKIAKNIFGTDLMLKKLLEWGFPLNKKDIYPGKEIEGLKYFNLKHQLSELALKFNISFNDDPLSPEIQKKIILTAVTFTARACRFPPIVAMLVCSPENYWMNIQSTSEDIPPGKYNTNWQPMQINDQIYKDAFPGAAMDIEMNIKYGITVLKKLRKNQKNWAKTIVGYNLDSPISIGKPCEQKHKALTGIKVLNDIIKKMEKNDFNLLANALLTVKDENDISYGFLYEELIKFRNYIKDKYL